MKSRTLTAIVVALALVVLTAGLTFAQTSQPETAQACIGVSGRLRLYEGGACPNGSTPVVVDLGPDAPPAEPLPGTIYDATTVAVSYQHDQGAADRIVECPDGRVVISGWAFADNDIPLPVVLNNTSGQFSTYAEIHVAGSGSGPWPTNAGQLAQGTPVFYGLICARVAP